MDNTSMRYDRVFMIGLMGVGKTTVGMRLAERFGYQHWDMDQEIVREAGCSIVQIFAQQGEAAFREHEQQVLERLTQMPHIVLSTGGGCIEREHSRLLLRQRGAVVYLHGAPDMLHARLRHDQQRPLLQTADRLSRLRDLYAKRDPLYRETAHVVVETCDASLRFTTDNVILALNRIG